MVLKLFIITLLTQLALGLNVGSVRADNIGLDDGTETTLSAAQISELQDWAKNSKADLLQLLDDVQSLGASQTKAQLIRGIRDVVLASAPKTAETLMRYVLNRALKTIDEIEKDTEVTRAGVVDQENRILIRSAELATQYYQNDVDYLNGKLKDAKSGSELALAYAQFGLTYADFLIGINDSLLNISAQYKIGLFVLGFLENDLDRDQNKTQYAAQILRINKFLRTMPEQPLGTDSETIAAYRLIKRTFLQTQASLPDAPGSPPQATDPTLPGSKGAAVSNSDKDALLHKMLLSISTTNVSDMMVVLSKHPLTLVQLPDLVALSANTYANIRYAAVELMAQITDPDCTNALIRKLADQNPDVRSLAMTEVKARNISNQGMILALIKMIPLSDSAGEIETLLMKQSLGSYAIPALHEEINNKNPSIRYNAVAMLGKIDTVESTSILMDEMQDANADVRQLAQETLKTRKF